MSESTKETVTCHDMLNQCLANCPDLSECVFVDECNGQSKKYICEVFDYKLVIAMITFSIIGLIMCCGVIGIVMWMRQRNSVKKTTIIISDTATVGKQTH